MGVAVPSIKICGIDSLQGVQHPQGHHLAGPQHRLGMFGQGLQPVVDPAEQVHDKINGGYGRSPLAVNRRTLQS